MQINCLLNGTLPKKPGLYLSRFRILLFLIFLGSFFVPTTGLKAQCQAGQITVDGNPCEWNNISGFTTKSYVRDAFGSGVVDSQFTQGSKDFIPALENRWEVGQTKAKNDIANGAAVLIGDLLYFAGDRTSNNGDAQIGFWFLLNGTAPVELNGVKLFSPEHADGDLLVLADFTGGGRDANVIVLRWNGNGTGTYPNSDGNFDLVTVAAAVAINNNDLYPVPGSWDFINPEYDINEFYEGFIDLGDLPANTNKCFSSFMLETRSSQSITASLDDFVSGGFNAKPAPPTVPTQARCGSGSVTLTATCVGSSVRWYTTADGVTPISSNATYTVSGNTLTIINLTATATFYAACYNADLNCESDRTAVIATVNPLPVCNITGNLTICAGNTTTLTASGGASYSWTGPGGFTAATAAITVGTAGQYTVVVTSAAGCTSSCNRTVIVNPLPVCNITGNLTICAGTTTTLTATGGASYSWTGPGGFTAATAAITVGTAGQYTVVVTSAAGCTSTCNRTVIVNPLPECNITGNLTICAGQSTTLTATGGASYAWTGPGGFTAATAAITVGTAGQYTVVVTSAAGCTTHVTGQ